MYGQVLRIKCYDLIATVFASFMDNTLERVEMVLVTVIVGFLLVAIGIGTDASSWTCINMV